jgi:DNA-binding beta-propeller fold protein YncE
MGNIKRRSAAQRYVARRTTMTTAFCTLVLMLAPVEKIEAADKTNQYDYAYGNRAIINSVAGFGLARTIDASADAISVGNGKLYLADSNASVIQVLSAADYSLITTITGGDSFGLTKPEGLYLSEALAELYIADTGAERILVLDAENYTLKRIITRPANMAGLTNFRPAKIAVDTSGRIYCVVSGSYEGLLELNPDGAFSRYFGVNTPEINLLDYFWKSIASRDQKQKMAKTFAPPFSNLDIDREGFVYAVTHDTASEKMIFRFNAKGENVIREEGYIDLRGDLTRSYVNKDVASAFTGISVAGFGAYAVVDRSYGRVFVYDFDGYMLTVFSKLGDTKGDLREPASIAWNGYDLLVGDTGTGKMYVYTPTDFGRAALAATEYYNRGDWERATAYFEEAIGLNANFYAGYSGVGRNYLMRREYEQAMYDFKMASDTKMYSQAYNGYRGAWIQKNFVWFLAAVIVLVLGVIFSEVRYARKRGEAL